MRHSTWILTAALLACTCGGEPPTLPPAQPEPAPPTPVGDAWISPPADRTLAGGTDGAVVYAALDVATTPPPGEFTAPIGPIPAEEWPSTLPPRAWLQARLCLQDTELWDRMDRSLAAALAAGAPMETEESYGGLVRYCDAPGFCAFAGRRHAGPPTARRLADLALSTCKDPASDALLLEPSTSDAARLLRLEGYGPSPSAAFLRATAPAFPSAVGKLDDYALGGAAETLGGLADPAVSAALRAAHAAATEPSLKRSLAVALGGQADPEARALYLSVCGSDDPAPGCAATAELPGPEPSPCAAPGWEDNEWELDGCLAAAAASDWKAAQAIARRHPDAGSDAVEVLLHHESADAWEKSLRSQRILTGTRAGAGPMPLRLPELLVAHGQAWGFDVETGQWPNEHDALLTRLASLGSGALKEVIFGEAAPPIEGMHAAHEAPIGSYILTAWADGRRYSVRAQDLGDWYDLEAVLGMLNSLARERHADQRWVGLPSDGQYVTVAALSPEGVVAAMRAGLLSSGGAGAAASDGKAFEEKVLEQLRREGLPE